ncbi:peptidase M28-like protein [Acidovorax sp. 100]|uniref:M28 family metallopeptidase n=1 Tax=Acidovorax sp. 100 TaxID=2135635 RepID=UPI000EF98F0F|nr:M28 family peptidase [Acidovorax sp. 100]RMA59970.1 peptidase M28-like protein [Acidovorax sp. 100]
MLTPFETDLLARVRSDAAWQLVETYSHTRRELPDEFERGAAILAERLDALGLPVRQDRPSLYLGVPRSATIQCNGKSYATKATALSPQQAPLTAPLIHVPARDGASRHHTNDPALIFGDGHTRETLRAKVAGKVVLTEGLSNPGRSELLEALGALAIITINPGKAVHWGASSVVWGNPTLDDVDRLPGIVSMAVNREDGHALVAEAVRGATITVSADVLHGWFPQTVTTVDIPAGSGDTGEFVLLHGQHDSWDLGVGDNATGNGVMMEVARALHGMRDHLKRGIRIAWWPGHSAGRYAGSTWYADQYAFDLRAGCVAHLNCDSPGCKDATDYQVLRGMAETQPLIAGAVADLFQQTCSLERPSRGGDYSFNNLGLSGALVSSSMVPAAERQRRGWYSVGGNGGSPTWHTEDDRMEVADRSVLENDTRLYTLLAARLACEETPMLDYRLPLTDIARSLDSVALHAGAAVDLQPHRRLLQALSSGVAQAYGEGSARPDAARWQGLKNASRSIVRMGYCERGIFEQDAAFATPLVPALRSATRSEEGGSAHVSLQRGANQMRHELECALAALS